MLTEEARTRLLTMACELACGEPLAKLNDIEALSYGQRVSKRHYMRALEQAKEELRKLAVDLRGLCQG